MVITMRLII